MLEDKDRIFTNIYGMKDRSLKGAMARGHWDKTADLIASGISEALITTEMGLLVALPGYALAYLVKARRDEYEAFLARLESFTLLTYDGGSGGRPPQAGSDPESIDVVTDDDLMGSAMPA